MFRLAAIAILLGLVAHCYSKKIGCDTKFSDLVGGAMSVVCPKNCLKKPGKVCGTGNYSKDSAVCKSALHAGNLLDSIGGSLGILKKPRRKSYRKSFQHGVHSAQCTKPGPSFSFAHKVRAVAYYRRPDVPAGTSVDCSNIGSFPGRANNCEAGSCQNGGTCTSGEHHFTCTCPTGFTGGDCSHALDSCNPSPCLNGGTCHTGQNEFICSCTNEYAGQTCGKPIAECYAGVNNASIIANSQMTASSEWNPTLGAQMARLNKKGFVNQAMTQGCWAPGSPTTAQWLKVDFLTKKKLYGVITQGRPVNAKQYFESYKLSYSDNDSAWKFIKNAKDEVMVFEGNTDRDTHKVNRFPTPITARYMKITPVTWYGFPSLRLEYLLC